MVSRPYERPPGESEAGPGMPVMVFIRELAVETVIGVHDHERQHPRKVMLDLDIELFASRAGCTDHIGDTVDYAVVVDRIRSHLAKNHYYLLERAAEVIADRILEEFRARRVRIRIAKLGILEGVGRVGVEICRTQSREAATHNGSVVPLRAGVAFGER